MPKCPNCGLETLRTADWACQWCGYPLLSSFYKMIPKTYKHLKKERLYKTNPIPEYELEPEPESVVESEPELVLESQPEPITEPEREVEPIPEYELEPEPESMVESKPELVLESQPESITEPEREVEPIPEAVATELTVEELLSAYATDGVAADTKFANELLRIAGVVAMIDVKEKLDIHYIRLTDAKRNLLQSVQCMFDKKHAPVLQQLEIGQTVTVQGIYKGSLIAIRMVDCVLV